MTTTDKEEDLSPPAAAKGFPVLPPVPGVELATVEAGVRYHGRKDVMLARLAPGTTLAGVYTQSATRAWPVEDCVAKTGLPPEGGAAILVNSGNANAFTGHHGLKAVQAISAAVSKALGISETRVFVASTGVIGEPLPYERITEKIDRLAERLSPYGLKEAAEAIMTTDTHPKGAGTVVSIGDAAIHIAGIAKGAGMIAPDMATMLVFIFTDARIAQPVLQEMLSDLAGPTFNSITVDGDTSTSDTLILAATGQSAAPEITRSTDPAAQIFRKALHGVMLDLAHQVVRDGEGATKFVEIRVRGAANAADARKVAMAIANSPLVKTAFAGEDPNWGRIVMAVGKSGARADRDRLSIRFGDILVAENGWVAPGYDEAAAAAYMKNPELKVTVDLGIGGAESTVWTCDFTQRYVAINADYRS